MLRARSPDFMPLAEAVWALHAAEHDRTYEEDQQDGNTIRKDRCLRVLERDKSKELLLHCLLVFQSQTHSRGGRNRHATEKQINPENQVKHS